MGVSHDSQVYGMGEFSAIFPKTELTQNLEKVSLYSTNTSIHDTKETTLVW